MKFTDWDGEGGTDEESDSLCNQRSGHCHTQKHCKTGEIHRLIGHEVNSDEVNGREDDLKWDVSYRLGQVISLETVPVVQVLPYKHFPFQWNCNKKEMMDLPFFKFICLTYM